MDKGLWKDGNNSRTVKDVSGKVIRWRAGNMKDKNLKKRTQLSNNLVKQSNEKRCE